MGFLAEAAKGGAAASELPGWEFWSAAVSFLTAVVMIIGPAVVRKLFPGDDTVAEIAKNSTARVADTLDATLTLVKDDIGAMRAQIEENGRKLESIGRGRR